MQPFLELVAQHLYHTIGNDLSHTAIVFPNKRAGLFFNDYLARQSQQPVWSPTYITINELFASYPLDHPLLTGDTITLVCELYQVYLEETQRSETLDDFYFWGELLISDFDDVDKNMVPAERLFSNLQELHELSRHNDFLTPEQQEAINQFFTNFSPEQRTELKERFISLWDKMLPIYQHYKERLAAKGMAYEGMLERAVMEQFRVEAMPYERYVFVGFNVLNRVEQALFSRLHEAGKALFYWDYDLFYTRQPQLQQVAAIHEAGEFILRNLKQFPNQLDESHFDTMRQGKSITFIESPTENAQARYLTQWLRRMYQRRPEKPFRENENAVVLCNETLLLPVLHAIPGEVENTNITMGYPLAQTPIFSLINALCTLQTEGYQRQNGTYLYDAVRPVLAHPYVRQLTPMADTLLRQLTEKNRFYPTPAELQADDLLTTLFTPVEGISALCRYLMEALRLISALYRKPTDKPHEDADNEDANNEEKADDTLYDQLYKESLFKSYTLLNRLYAIAGEQAFGSVRPTTFRKLLSRLLNAATIPFHGEPAIGMQVMGVLETRNLDFRNLLMLSVNEGKLPKNEGDSSFIPYNLRKAFGMTTIDHKNCVYAYYFYRLIQRAEQVTLIYNSSSDGLNRGEMSRFMLQLLVESPHPIMRLTLQADQAPRRKQSLEIERTPEMMAHLRRRFDATQPHHAILSPTALNYYLDCKLRFYFRFVATIHPAPEVTTEIDSLTFGNIFHRSCELIYRDLTAHGRMIQSQDLQALLDNPQRVKAYVDAAFKELFFQIPADQQPAYNGLQLINREVIYSYLCQLLRHDLRYAPFTIEGMEENVTNTITLTCQGEPYTVEIGGKVDRMDGKEGTLRIVDYKTGGTPMKVSAMEQLFTPAADRPGYALQAFLYASILSKSRIGEKVVPALLYIHKAAESDYSPVIVFGERGQSAPIANFAEMDAEFTSHLHRLLFEIFNSKEPFKPTEEGTHCEYCEFASLCRR